MWDDTQAEGMTDPNPMVGAVVVKDGIVRPSPAIFLDTARHSSTGSSGDAGESQLVVCQNWLPYDEGHSGMPGRSLGPASSRCGPLGPTVTYRRTAAGYPAAPCDSFSGVRW